MVRGETQQTMVHWKGEVDDFIVFAEDPAAVRKWRSDKTVPLTDVVQSFKVFVTHKQGTQGTYDGASKSSMDNEFGTSNQDEVIMKILQDGTMQEIGMPERQGARNMVNGGGPRQ